jgi:hypothetical protein
MTAICIIKIDGQAEKMAINGPFLCLSSSKKSLDIETIFLAEKVGFYGFY